jgi:hypothetical protein
MTKTANNRWERQHNDDAKTAQYSGKNLTYFVKKICSLQNDTMDSKICPIV